MPEYPLAYLCCTSSQSPKRATSRVLSAWKVFFRLTILVSFLISYFMQDSKTAAKSWVRLGSSAVVLCGVLRWVVLWWVWYVWWVHSALWWSKLFLGLVQPSSCCCGLAAKYDKMLREFGTLTSKGRGRGRDAVSGKGEVDREQQNSAILCFTVEIVRKCHRWVFTSVRAEFA